MATLDKVFTDIANSVRGKTGKAEKITPEQMATEIDSIEITPTVSPEPPYDINTFYPAKFQNFGGTLEELNKYLKSGGTKHLYTSMDRMFSSCSKLTTIPLLDISSVTNMTYMFAACSNLTTIPLLDTSNVTNMEGMFSGCSNLTTIPLLDTSNVTKMDSMFNYCSKLTTIPQLNTSKVLNMSDMFYECGSLTTIPLLDTSNVMNMGSMFNGCRKLTTIPLLDVSNVGNMRNMFQYCLDLTTVPALNCTEVYDMIRMFNGCRNLTEIHINNINTDLDIHGSTKMEQPALREVIDNLVKQSSGTKTLTLGSTLKAKLLPEDIQVATDKGWTIA